MGHERVAPRARRKTWAILKDIETADGNPVAAVEAKRQAIECYLAYRRDGGENHNPDGRICLAVMEALRTDGPEAAAERTVADNPELNYSMATEILLLIETLEQNEQQGV